MANVTHYDLVVYGGHKGAHETRAVISLHDGSAMIGIIRFHDPTMDYTPEGIVPGSQAVEMNLPSAMLEEVLGILSKGGTIDLNFAADDIAVCVLQTAKRPVGEAA